MNGLGHKEIVIQKINFWLPHLFNTFGFLAAKRLLRLLLAFGLSPAQ